MTTLTGVASVLLAATLLSPAGIVGSTKHSSPHVENAYIHLDESMDEWAKAPNLRVPSSYHAGFLDFWDNSVTYDNALVIIAYANRPNHAASLERAVTMGDALLQMQAKDPIGDGRLRNAYGPENLFDDKGVPNIQTWGSASGNQAWAGMAFAHLARATGKDRFLDGAKKVGQWLIRETSDSRGAGGFTGGYKSDGTKIMWKSSEHNIDMIGLFGMLHELTGDSQWAQARQRAETFVRSMWNNSEGRFAIGSKDDGVTTNNSEYIPEDVQSWAFLALEDRSLTRGLDWAIKHLQVTDRTYPRHPITGTRFALQTNPAQLDHNDSTVWLEGTAHMALALRCSPRYFHHAKSRQYLRNIEKAQLHGPNADRKGIQANSSVGHAGGDDVNYTSLHTGATSWYLMARQGINPFRLGKRC